LGAVGASAFSTAGATYVANLFPDKISVIMVCIYAVYFIFLLKTTIFIVKFM
jgi:hypothetical protein